MSTVLRTELSKRNKYYISKHRRLELEHFCRQYPEWKNSILITYVRSIPTGMPHSTDISDPTSEVAIRMVKLTGRCELIESCAIEASESLWRYILTAVTKGFSYTTMSTLFNIPCGKDMFYDALHRFYYILSERRD